MALNRLMLIFLVVVVVGIWAAVVPEKEVLSITLPSMIETSNGTSIANGTQEVVHQVREEDPDDGEDDPATDVEDDDKTTTNPDEDDDKTTTDADETTGDDEKTTGDDTDEKKPTNVDNKNCVCKTSQNICRSLGDQECYGTEQIVQCAKGGVWSPLATCKTSCSFEPGNHRFCAG